jgi:hypothetical protein
MMKEKISVKKTVRYIGWHTRKQNVAEEKIRIVLEGLRGKDSIAELCRREGLILMFITAGLWLFGRGLYSKDIHANRTCCF